MQRHDHRHQMQTDPGTRDPGRIAAAKVALEQALTIARRNADAAVAHLHDQPP